MKLLIASVLIFTLLPTPLFASNPFIDPIESMDDILLALQPQANQSVEETRFKIKAYSKAIAMLSRMQRTQDQAQRSEIFNEFQGQFNAKVLNIPSVQLTQEEIGEVIAMIEPSGLNALRDWSTPISQTLSDSSLILASTSYLAPAVPFLAGGSLIQGLGGRALHEIDGSQIHDEVLQSALKVLQIRYNEQLRIEKRTQMPGARTDYVTLNDVLTPDVINSEVKPVIDLLTEGTNNSGVQVADDSVLADLIAQAETVEALSFSESSGVEERRQQLINRTGLAALDKEVLKKLATLLADKNSGRQYNETHQKATGIDKNTKAPGVQKALAKGISKLVVPELQSAVTSALKLHRDAANLERARLYLEGRDQRNMDATIFLGTTLLNRFGGESGREAAKFLSVSYSAGKQLIKLSSSDAATEGTMALTAGYVGVALMLMDALGPAQASGQQIMMEQIQRLFEELSQQIASFRKEVVNNQLSLLAGQAEIINRIEAMSNELRNDIGNGRDITLAQIDDLRQGIVHTQVILASELAREANEVINQFVDELEHELDPKKQPSDVSRNSLRVVFAKLSRLLTEPSSSALYSCALIGVGCDPGQVNSASVYQGDVYALLAQRFNHRMREKMPYLPIWNRGVGVFLLFSGTRPELFASYGGERDLETIKTILKKMKYFEEQFSGYIGEEQEAYRNTIKELIGTMGKIYDEMVVNVGRFRKAEPNVKSAHELNKLLAGMGSGPYPMFVQDRLSKKQIESLVTTRADIVSKAPTLLGNLELKLSVSPTRGQSPRCGAKLTDVPFHIPFSSWSQAVIADARNRSFAYITDRQQTKYDTAHSSIFYEEDFCLDYVRGDRYKRFYDVQDVDGEKYQINRFAYYGSTQRPPKDRARVFNLYIGGISKPAYDLLKAIESAGLARREPVVGCCPTHQLLQGVEYKVVGTSPSLRPQFSLPIPMLAARPSRFKFQLNDRARQSFILERNVVAAPKDPTVGLFISGKHNEWTRTYFEEKGHAMNRGLNITPWMYKVHGTHAFDGRTINRARDLILVLHEKLGQFNEEFMQSYYDFVEGSLSDIAIGQDNFRFLNRDRFNVYKSTIRSIAKRLNQHGIALRELSALKHLIAGNDLAARHIYHAHSPVESKRFVPRLTGSTRGDGAPGYQDLLEVIRAFKQDRTPIKALSGAKLPESIGDKVKRGLMKRLQDQFSSYEKYVTNSALLEGNRCGLRCAVSYSMSTLEYVRVVRGVLED